MEATYYSCVTRTYVRIMYFDSFVYALYTHYLCTVLVRRWPVRCACVFRVHVLSKISVKRSRRAICELIDLCATYEYTYVWTAIKGPSWWRHTRPHRAPHHHVQWARREPRRRRGARHEPITANDKRVPVAAAEAADIVPRAFIRARDAQSKIRILIQNLIKSG